MNSYSKRRGAVTLACKQPLGCIFVATATTWRPAKRALADHMAAGVHDMGTTPEPKAPRKRKPRVVVEAPVEVAAT